MDDTAIVLDDSEKLMLMCMAGAVARPNLGVDMQHWMYLEHNELLLVATSVSELFDFFLEHTK
jgi:hypothetical protein